MMVFYGKSKTLFREGVALYPFIMAAAKFVLGVLTPSVFLCVYSLYDVGIGLTRAVGVTRKSEKPSDETNFCAYLIGWFLLTSSLFFMFYSMRVFLGVKTITYSVPIAVVIAVSTFIQLCSVISGFLNRKGDDSIVKAIKLVNLSSVITSLAITREALLSITIGGDILLSAGLAGLIFGSATSLISLYLIISMGKTLQENKFVFTRRIAHQIVKRCVLDFVIHITSIKKALCNEVIGICNE